MINEEILRLLLERQRVLLRGVGVLHLERHWAQVSSDGSEIIPPYDELIFSYEGEMWDVDLSEAVAQICGGNYDDGHRIWCDFLALEAVDGVLTIQGVAMLDVENLCVVAMDPDFAHQLNPDGEVVSLLVDQNFDKEIGGDRRDVEQMFSVSSSKNIKDQFANGNDRGKQRANMVKIPSKPSGLGAAGYFGIVLAIASVLYLVYFFTK